MALASAPGQGPGSLCDTGPGRPGDAGPRGHCRRRPLRRQGLQARRRARSRRRLTPPASPAWARIAARPRPAAPLQAASAQTTPCGRLRRQRLRALRRQRLVEEAVATAMATATAASSGPGCGDPSHGHGGRGLRQLRRWRLRLGGGSGRLRLLRRQGLPLCGAATACCACRWASSIRPLASRQRRVLRRPRRPGADHAGLRPLRVTTPLAPRLLRLPAVHGHHALLSRGRPSPEGVRPGPGRVGRAPVPRPKRRSRGHAPAPTGSPSRPCPCWPPSPSAAAGRRCPARDPRHDPTQRA